MQGEFPDFQKEEVTRNLYRHVEHFSVKIGERHLWRNGSLSQAAEYVESFLASYGYEVWRQTYSCYSKSVSIDTLDFEQMAEVVRGLHLTLLDF